MQVRDKHSLFFRLESRSCPIADLPCDCSQMNGVFVFFVVFFTFKILNNLKCGIVLHSATSSPHD